MSTHRAIIKAAAVALLDSKGDEHASRHQKGYARRYTIKAPGGLGLDVMFQQDPKSPPHLWALTKAVVPLVDGSISQKSYPAAALWTKNSPKTGKKIYGRHSALKTMPQLCNADLTRFTPASPAEVTAIVDQIVAASAAGGV